MKSKYSIDTLLKVKTDNQGIVFGEVEEITKTKVGFIYKITGSIDVTEDEIITSYRPFPKRKQKSRKVKLLEKSDVTQTIESLDKSL